MCYYLVFHYKSDQYLFQIKGRKNKQNWIRASTMIKPILSQKKKSNGQTSFYNPRLAEPNDRTEFLFPQSRQMFQNITNKMHLRALLAEQSKKHGVTIQLHSYCFQRNDRSYLYSKCIQCGHKQKMKFLKVNSSDEYFKLIFFDNTHNHTNFSKKRKGQYNIAQIFQIMQNTPKNMPIDQFKVYLKNIYDINDSHFYYMLSRFRKFHQSIRSITEYLKKHNAKIWTQIFKIDQDPNSQDTVDILAQQDPPFFMFVLPQMQANFQRYGELCYFSIRKSLVKKKCVIQNKQWDIIAFNGLSHHNKFAPFAIGFLQVNQHSFTNTVQIIKRTFNWIKKTPKTLITPYGGMYTQLVKTLNKKNIFNGFHIFDALQQIQDYKKVVSVDQLKFFQDIVLSKYRHEFYENVQIFFKNVVPTLQVRRLFNNLMKRAPRMCFALVNTDNFIGSGYKHSANKFMTLMIRYLYTHNSIGAKNNPIHPKELYPSIKFIAKEFIKIMTPELPYIQFDTWKFQHFMHIPEMQLIRHRLKMASMDIFLSQFNKSLHVDVRERYKIQSSVGQMKVYDVFDRNSSAIYVVAPHSNYTDDNVFNKMIWKCNCLYSMKCGMPCCHQLKVTLMNGHSMLQQIHPKWIQVKVGRKKAPGRPKVSRRNNTH